ncbi:MAG: winged helix-turn-helix transcriptional regulator [Thermoplasmatota archaeon]
MEKSLTALLALLLILSLPLWSVRGEGEESGDAEPNDELALAQSITPGGTGRYYLSEEWDGADWFRVQAGKGMVLHVTLYALDWPDLNASLEVYTMRDDGPRREGYSISPHRYESVSVVTPLSGYQYIRAFVEPGGGSGNYSLTATVEEPLAASSGGRYSGTLQNSTDHPSDIYRIWLLAGDVIRVSMSETPIPPARDVSLDLYLMDLWPSSPIYTYLDISWWSDPREALEARAPHEGYFFIIVTAFNGSGYYDMSVAVEAGESGGDDFPPQSRPVYSTTSVDDAVDQAFDHYDWYRFSAAAGSSLRATVTLRSGWGSGIFELFLVDEDLRPLESVTNYVCETGEDPYTVDRIELARELEAEGVLYIVLMAKWGLSPTSPRDLTDASAAANYTIDFRVVRDNSPPRVVRPPLMLSTDEDSPLRGLLLKEVFDDPDIVHGDSLSFAAAGSTHLEPRVSTDSELVVIPAPDWSGREEIRVIAVDSAGASTAFRTNVTVLAVSDPPFVTAPPSPISLVEGLSYPFLLDASECFDDPDLPYGDRLSYRVSPSAIDIRVDALGTISSGPVAAPPGEHVLLLTAVDSAGLEAAVELRVTVLRTPKPPSAISSSIWVDVDEDTPHLGPALSELFLDPDGQPLTAMFRHQGRVSVTLQEDGLLLIAPAEDWSGTEEVFIEVWDTEGLSANTTLIVVVRPVPDPPRLLSVHPEGNLTVGADSDEILRVTASDPDSEELSYFWLVDGLAVNSSSRLGNALALKRLSSGNHIIRVVVRDPGGLECSHSWAVTVLAPPSGGAQGAAARSSSAAGAAAAVGLAAWLAALVGVSEQGKYALLKLIVVPLYTKIRREEVLDHFTRGRIYGIVESSPGVHYTLIKKRLGVGNGTLTYHLATLEREGFIRAEWDGLYKRFYPAGFPASRTGAVEPGPVQKEILGLVSSRPGVSQKEIALETGLSKRVVSYHISRLMEVGLIRVRRDGKSVLCYPGEGEGGS